MTIMSKRAEVRVMSGCFFLLGAAFVWCSAEMAGLMDVMFIKGHLVSNPLVPHFAALGGMLTFVSVLGLWLSSRM